MPVRVRVHAHSVSLTSCSVLLPAAGRGEPATVLPRCMPARRAVSLALTWAGESFTTAADRAPASRSMTRLGDRVYAGSAARWIRGVRLRRPLRVRSSSLIPAPGLLPGAPGSPPGGAPVGGLLRTGGGCTGSEPVEPAARRGLNSVAVEGSFRAAGRSQAGGQVTGAPQAG